MNENNINNEKKKSKAVCVGFDLGTTNSCIAFDGKVIVNAEGDNVTPSIFSISADGRRIVGKSAQRQAAVRPGSSVSMIKRHMGEVIEIGNEKTRYSVKLEGDNGKIIELSPEQISAEIIIKLISDAEKSIGKEISGIVITVPAYFNDSQKKATADAVKIASSGLKAKKGKDDYELSLLRIINEPTASSLAYGLDKSSSDQTIIVYDLGGGTFDVSIIKISGGIFQVLAVSGHNRLGGEDFDDIICNDILIDNFQKDKNNQGFDVNELLKNKRSMQILREAAKNAKHDLSYNEVTTVQIANIAFTNKPLHLDCLITRKEFEENSKIKSYMNTTKEKIFNALNDANLKPVDIDQVVLVGGSTRMPMVENLISGIFGGKKINRTVNPDEVVAIGASIQASILAGDVKDVVLLDVTPLSLGIETLGDVMSFLIPRNTTIPVSRDQVFSTARDNQPSVQISVYEGERLKSKENKLLGVFELTGIERAPMGVPQIKVKFSVDANGILSVTATDQKTGSNHSITVQSINLSDEEIERMKAEAEANAENDKIFQANAEILIRAQSYLYTFKKQDEEMKKKIVNVESNEDYRKFSESCKKLEESIDKKDYKSLENQLNNEINGLLEISNRLMEEVKKNEANNNNSDADNNSSDKGGENKNSDESVDIPNDDKSGN